MSQSITNNLIANIKQSSFNNTNNFSNSEKVICIDSSNNRIGINTRNPQYSIEISGSTLKHGLKASYIEIDNSANINEISSNKIVANIIDVSDLLYKELSGNVIYANTISAENIQLSTLTIPDININDICVNKLTILTDLICDAPVARFKEIKVDIFEFQQKLDLEQIDVSNLTVNNKLIVDLSAIIEDLCFNIANGNKLKVADISINNLDVSNSAIFNNGLQVISGEASFNSIIVEGSCNLSTLTINGENIDNKITSEIKGALQSAENIDCSNITINSKLTNSNDSNNTSEIGFLKILNNLTFDDDGSLNIINGHLIVPYHGNIEDETNYYIKFDATEKILHIGDTQFKQNKTKFVNLKTIDTSLNNEELKDGEWIIEATSELANSQIFNKDSNNYKFFDISLNRSNMNDDFDICNNKIIIFDISEGDILNINANISLKLLNKYPGDIETKNYSFGIYLQQQNNQSDICLNYFDNELTEIRNSIMVFDSSYNYANSSLSYIYENNNTNGNIKGISFLIKEVDDLCLNNIIVKDFNATITLTS